MARARNYRNDPARGIREEVKRKLPGVDVDNASADKLKDMILNEIENNKDLNIDDTIKEKIRKGDIDGLKKDLASFLKKNPSAGGMGKQLLGLLQNNDLDGIKNQLMSVLSGFNGSEKKKR